MSRRMSRRFFPCTRRRNRNRANRKQSAGHAPAHRVNLMLAFWLPARGTAIGRSSCLFAALSAASLLLRRQPLFDALEPLSHLLKHFFQAIQPLGHCLIAFAALSTFFCLAGFWFLAWPLFQPRDLALDHWGHLNA